MNTKLKDLLNYVGEGFAVGVAAGLTVFAALGIDLSVFTITAIAVNGVVVGVASGIYHYVRNKS